MEPNRGENLPAPRFETPSAPQESGVEDHHEAAHEVETSGEAATGKQQPKLTPPPQTTTNQPTTPPLPVPTTQSPTTPSATDDITASDLDLIEKSWVHATKKVISQTKDDPHKQKDEVSKVKVDYLKKRFNKTLPLDDPVGSK